MELASRASPGVRRGRVRELVFLGTGTGVPYTRRAGPGLLLQGEEGEGATMLDCGPDAPHAAAAAGWPLEAIARILVTHFHTDHTMGLLRVLFAQRHPALARRGRPLEILGPRGIRSILEGFQRSYGSWVRWDPATIRVREIEAGTFRAGPLDVEAIPVHHTPQSLALRIRLSDGFVVAYSGDTGRCEGAVRCGREADLFVLECSLPEEDPPLANEHLTPTAAGEIADRAAARRTVLTHCYPAVDRIDAISRARARANVAIDLAEDGLRLPLPAPADRGREAAGGGGDHRRSKPGED